MNRRLERVRSASLRVALISAAVTAVAFAAIALAVVLYVGHTLTGQVDTRLTQSVQRVQEGRLPLVPLGTLRDPSGSRFGPPLLAWLVDGDGTVTPIDPNAPLPPQDRYVTSPQTITIAGTEVRVAGGQVGGVHVIIGQNISSVTQALSTIIVAESTVGSVLLVVVFLGALWVGRRVGSPIELARQRQLEFTADASHELRTPLSVIEAQTSLALSQQRDAAWYRQAFERVGGESRRIRHLVEDLLWLARVDTPENTPRAEPVDVVTLAAHAVERFAGVAEAHGLRLALAPGPQPQIVSASTDWVDRLLGVLIDNACKYTPAGGQVLVSVGGDGNRVRLSVEDSGPGIPSEERTRIFDRFHRASSGPGGAGLGLAIADAVVRHTHGRWDVGSSLLGGARMAVTWPRVMGGAREAPRQQQAAARVPAP